MITLKEIDAMKQLVQHRKRRIHIVYTSQLFGCIAK